ncbi:MAG: hypothetical protein LBK61_10950 [Spirochaetaceae bacterium]|jgi:hypothetical protein|nr:hypothetical protein [Spirochaetaceae bacterium]
MGAKRFLGFGLPVVLLALGLVVSALLTLAGCEVTEGSGDGYRINFKVDNYSSQEISKVEFINGDTQNDKVVGAYMLSLPVSQRSSEYRVYGFTIEYGSSTRRFGVKVTFADGTTRFASYYAGHESKILVSVGSSYYNYISFSTGNW